MSSLTPRLDKIELASTNLIINGGFSFWQRSTSATIADGGTYPTADRFGYYKQSTNGLVASSSLDTSIPIPTVGGVLKTTVNTASSSSDYLELKHYIEGNNLRSVLDEDMVLSFMVKASVAGTYAVSFRITDNNVSNSVYAFVSSYTVDQADTWEKKSVKVNIPFSIFQGFINSNDALNITWNLGYQIQTTTLNQWISGQYTSFPGAVDISTTAGATFSITAVSLTRGTTAPDTFVRAGGSHDVEDMLVKRYWQRLYLYEFPIVAYTANGDARAMFTFPRMRKTPSLNLVAGATVGIWFGSNSLVANVAWDIATFAAKNDHSIILGSMAQPTPSAIANTGIIIAGSHNGSTPVIIDLDAEFY